MSFNKYVWIYLPLFLLSLIIVSNCYCWELADLAKGDTQTMTMPILHEGEQFIFTYKYKYGTSPNPLFAGPIIYQFDLSTGNINKLEANDRRGINVILKVEALMAELVRSGKEKFIAGSEAVDQKASLNSEDVKLLGQSSDSATGIEQGNNTSLLQIPASSFPSANPTIDNNGSLVGGFTTATEGPLPNGQAIYTRRSTAMAIESGKISTEDLKPEDYKALSHSVIENEDGSITVTVVVPQGSKTNTTLLTQELALTPRLYTSNASKIVSSGSIKMNLNGPTQNLIDSVTGNKTITRTYFVTR
jgi:hypothetical protein